MLKRLSRSILFLTLAFIGFAHPAHAQKDKIEGLWFNEEKTSKIEIYKAVDGKFWGKIVWLKTPDKDGKPRVDENNPKEKYRKTPLLGLAILKRFNPDGDEKYDDGEIYDPKNGKTYSCTITYRNSNELGIRGYVGISLLGRTTTWTRAQ